jgi:hypothetical protein
MGRRQKNRLRELDVNGADPEIKISVCNDTPETDDIISIVCNNSEKKSLVLTL